MLLSFLFSKIEEYLLIYVSEDAFIVYLRYIIEKIQFKKIAIYCYGSLLKLYELAQQKHSPNSVTQWGQSLFWAFLLNAIPGGLVPTLALIAIKRREASAAIEGMMSASGEQRLAKKILASMRTAVPAALCGKNYQRRNIHRPLNLTQTFEIEKYDN